MVGAGVLIALTYSKGSPWLITSLSVYSLALVLLYTFSTLHHSIQAPRAKHVFRVLDHSSIFVLIAGTYTPFMLVVLQSGWSYLLLSLNWLLAVLGIVFKAFFVGRFPVLSILMYLIMGWMVVVVLKPLGDQIHWEGLAWLVTGGLFYTLGIIFYSLKKVPFSHAVWHLFVLAGSIIHYFSIVYFVLPK